MIRTPGMMSPNFFIIGGPKCGTTALSEYLRQHRDICFSSPKEPMYFAEDMPNLRTVSEEEGYLRCYANCSNRNPLAVGEGSALYLLSRFAVPGIFKFNPAAKLIIMVRNPMHMAVSMHAQNLFYGDENVQSFDKAWALQESRARAENVPAKCRDPILLQYARICMLGEQVSRALSVVPKEQCHVVVFDDLIGKPRETYLQVLEFLGVPDDGKSRFEKINERKSVKWPWMMNILARPPKWLMNAALRIRFILGVQSLGIHRAIVKINRAPAPEYSVGGDTQEAMIRAFSEDIDLLGRTLQRNLDEWKISRK
jgi:hypothetical protein